jgi:hypothetical protein
MTINRVPLPKGPPQEGTPRQVTLSDLVPGKLQSRTDALPTAGAIFGILLIVAGVIVTIVSMCMDVGSGESLGGRELANLDKMNQRLGLVLVGSALFISGVVTVCMNAIHVSLWKLKTHLLTSATQTKGVVSHGKKAK